MLKDRLKKRTSLVTKLIVSLSIAYLLSFIPIIGYSTYKDYSLQKEELIKNSQIQLERLSYNLVIPLWNIDVSSIETIVYHEIKNPALASITIYDEQNNVLYAHDKHIAEEYIFSELKNPINYQGYILGYVYLRYSEHETKQRLAHNFFRVLVIAIVIIILLDLVTFVLFYLLLTRRIINLSSSIRMIEKGDYSHAVKETTRDEIGFIARSVARMQEELQIRDEQTKEYIANIKFLQDFSSGIIETIPSALITVDKNFEVTHINEAAVTEFKRERIEILGKNFFSSYAELTEIIEKDIPIVETVLEKKTVKLTQMKREGNPAKYYNVIIAPIKDNEHGGAVIQVDNVTEAVNKDEQLKQAQKMETLGTLVGGLAHDFNNALGGVIGVLSIIRHQLDSHEEVEQLVLEEYVSIMESASARAKDIVMQLLTFARKQEISRTRVELQGVVKNVTKICQSSFDKSIIIKTKLVEKPAIIKGDFTQIAQVLLNICINAGHAMTIMRSKQQISGGRLDITLEFVEAKEAFLKKYAEAKSINYWKISVQDTGVGIKQEVIDHIFEPFFTTKEQGLGTGLGLAMAYSIVKQHEGFMVVYSEEGVGTNFNILLPEALGNDTNEEQMERLILHRGEGTILVADDDSVMLHTAGLILQECGYDVLSAMDGQEAVEIFEEYALDIKAVILDLVMPKLNGRQVFHAIKKINPLVKVIITSGFRQDNRISLLMEEKVDYFIQKPYRIKDISEALDAIFNA